MEKVLRITNSGKWVIIEKHSQTGNESHSISYDGPEKTLRKDSWRRPEYSCPMTLAHVGAQLIFSEWMNGFVESRSTFLRSVYDKQSVFVECYGTKVSTIAALLSLCCSVQSILHHPLPTHAGCSSPTWELGKWWEFSLPGFTSSIGKLQ